MGRYQNGIVTQAKILDASRKLFYQKGYDQTTFADICRETGTNQSAIHYHFKSKENLLQIIYADTVRKNNELVEFYSDRSTGFLAKLFFDAEIYLYKVFHDSRYRQFYIDATRFWYNLDQYAEEGLGKFSYHRYHDESLPLTEEEREYNRMACAAFDQSVLIHINSHMDSLEFRTVFRQVIKMYKKILEISASEYETALAQLKVLEDRCKWDEIDTTLEP